MRIAIMQGRLSASETGALQEFPRRHWEEEFPRAAAAGLAAIEWLDDDYGAGANPLETDDGIARMRAASSAHGVAVRSLCAHWLAQRPLPREELLDRLEGLLGRCAAAGIERIVLPFLEAGARSEESELAEILGRALDAAEPTGIELLIETTLEPGLLGALVARLGHELLGVNFDSASEPASAVAVLGPWIRGVHLKDRDETGANVPIGTGNVDFRAVLAALRAAGYSGDLVLETPRPELGDEVASARRAVSYLEQLG